MREGKEDGVRGGQMEQYVCHPSAVSLYRQPSGDTTTREPPPYPGHLKLWQQSGFSTSYSGSETSTDMSMSSLESLSTSARQEPQGEETANMSPGLFDGGHSTADMTSSSPSLSNLCAGDLDSKAAYVNDGSTYTVTSQEAVPTATVQQPVVNGYSSAKMAGTQQAAAAVSAGVGGFVCPPLQAYPANSLIRQLLQNSPQYSHLLTGLAAPHGLRNTGSPKLLRGSDGRNLPANAVAGADGKPEVGPTQPVTASGPVSVASHHQAANCRLVNGYVNVIDSLGRGVVTSASASSTPPTNRGRVRPSTAPKERPTPGTATQTVDPDPVGHGAVEQLDRHHHRSCRELDQLVATTPVTERLVDVESGREGQGQQQFTRSSPPQQLQQQQLYNNAQYQQQKVPTSSCLLQQDHSNATDFQQAAPQTLCAHAAIATRATQMVERLSEENQALRRELKAYYKKVSNLEKVERDIQKVTEEYETLALHSQKRENLEKLMRLKLDSEISRLNEANQQIQDQLERSIIQLQRKQAYNSVDSELKKELQRKDALIAQLISQNRDLSTAKSRLESNAAVQRTAMQEARARVKMLENALAKDLDRQQLERQQSASSDHQVASETAGNNCKMVEQQQVVNGKYLRCDADDGISSDLDLPTNVQSLIHQMQEKEHQILQLEAEVMKWEQKYLEETVYRQLAVDAISIPKDAKIAALVQNSAEADKVMADARLEKLACLRELHDANERCAHLEAKVKSLQADLAEKETLVKVLQHHSSLSRASSISSLLTASCGGSPLNSPQHRSPTSTVMRGSNSVMLAWNSKPASGTSSRQGSQLSTGSGSFTRNAKANGNNLAVKPAISTQSAQQKIVSLDSVPFSSEPEELKQFFWQV